MATWTEDPRYQRAMQKLQRLSSDQRAVVSSAIVDESFGDAETRKMVAALNTATIRSQDKRRLDLDRRSQEARHQLGAERLEAETGFNKEMMGLRRKEFEFGKSQFPISTAIGAADVGLSGYQGYQKMRRDQQLARNYLGLSKLYK